MVSRRIISIVFFALLNTSLVVPLWAAIMFLLDFLENFETVYFTEKEGIFSFSYVHGSRIFFMIWLALLTLQIFIWSLVLLHKLFLKDFENG